MKIPSKIRIGFVDYTVKEVDAITDDQAWGLIDFNKAEIRLRNDIPANSKICTFFHEIIHGIIWNSAINTNKDVLAVVDVEEYLCKQFETGLAQVVEQIVGYNIIMNREGEAH